MATAGSIVVDLIARTGSFETDIQRAGKRLRSIEKDAKVAFTALAALTGAVAATAFTVFISETIQAEKEQAQLAAVLKSTGEAAGFSRKALNDMASSMSSLSTLSAGEINQAQTTLLAFTGIVGDEFPKALQAAIDMSARTGMSVVQAAETIGRALDVPSQGLSSLSKQGFRFSEDQKKLAERLEATGKTAEAQAIILDALEESYGGAAKAARDTFGGSVIALRNQLNDLMTGDEGSLDGAKDAVNRLTDTLSSEETRQAFGDFVQLIVDATNSFARFMTVINEGSFWGWVQTSGADARNAEAEIARLEKSLEGIAERRKGIAESWVPEASFIDTKILDAQEASIREKLKTLRIIAKQNRQDVEKEFGYLGLLDDNIPMLGNNIIRPPSPGGGKKGKNKKPERNYIAADLEEMLIRLGELDEPINAMEMRFEEATDKMGEFAVQAARNIQQSLGDGLYDILTGNFKDIGARFGEMITRMVADAAAANLASALFGDFDKSGQLGGWVGSLLGSIWPGPSQGNLTGGSLSGATWGPNFTFASGGFTGFGGK